MKILYLIHVDEIDEKAIISITIHCNNLNTLGLYNCDFNDMVVEQDDFSYHRRDKEKMELMLDLKQLSIVSACPAKYMILLLSSAINVEHFKSGQNPSITDADVLNLMCHKNQLVHLQSWLVPSSKLLSIKTVELLMENCENLR